MPRNHQDVLVAIPENFQAFKRLNSLYRRAFSHAVELYIATAFLTDWPHKRATVPVNLDCEDFRFYFGTDFGLTRKRAIEKVLAWLPKSHRHQLYAVVGNRGWGFHPKFILWKESGEQCYLIVGSSNLTKGGLTTNVEANVYLPISKDEYMKVRNDILSIDGYSTVVDKTWIDSYREAKLRSGAVVKGNNDSHAEGDPAIRQNPLQPPELHLSDLRRVLRERRSQKRMFSHIASRLQAAIFACAQKKLSKMQFYETLNNLWIFADNRFQAPGYERAGKAANWYEVCGSLSRILKAGSVTHVVDRVVESEVDWLKERKNPLRGAWLSEMLCQFRPKLYPVLNAPVNEWLQRHGVRRTRGMSEGKHYVELSRKLRHVLQKTRGAKDLAELDLIIFTAG